MQSVQDYGFRMYNPALGKFLSIDPLSKQYPWYTPYQFAGNKPIWAIDLDGLEEAYANGVVAYPNKEKAIRYDYTYPSGAMASTVPGSDTWYLSERDKDGFTTTYSWKPGEKNWSLINSERADYDDRNQSVAKLNNYITALTFGVPAAIMTVGTGFFAVEGLTWAGAGSGTADFSIQMAQNKGDINKWNITSTASQTFMPNPFGSAFVGSAGKVTVGDILNKDRKIYSSIQENTTSNIILETGIGGSFNVIGGTMFNGFKINERQVGIGNALEKYIGSYNANLIGNSGSTLVSEAIKNTTKDEERP